MSLSFLQDHSDLSMQVWTGWTLQQIYSHSLKRSQRETSACDHRQAGASGLLAEAAQKLTETAQFPCWDYFCSKVAWFLGICCKTTEKGTLLALMLKS